MNMGVNDSAAFLYLKTSRNRIFTWCSEYRGERARKLFQRCYLGWLVESAYFFQMLGKGLKILQVEKKKLPITPRLCCVAA